MIGPEGVTRELLSRIRSAMPAKLAELRTRYGCDAAALPDVALFAPFEIDVASIEKFPAMCIVPVRTTGRQDNRQTETSGEFDEYSFTYDMQAYAFARGDGRKITALRAHRYLLAIREILLERKGLTDALTIESRTIAESYSALTKAPQGQIFLQAGFVDVQVVSQESTTPTEAPIPVTVVHEERVTTADEPFPEWHIDL